MNIKICQHSNKKEKKLRFRSSTFKLMNINAVVLYGVVFYELCGFGPLQDGVWGAAVSRSVPPGGGSKTSGRHLKSFTQLLQTGLRLQSPHSLSFIANVGNLLKSVS